MTKIPFTMTGESLTLFVNGIPKTFHAGSVQYNQISEAILKQEWDRIPDLMTKNGALAQYLGDRFTVDEGGSLSFDGVPLPSALSGRITEMAGAGTDPSPLLRFYERLHKNPSYRSREQVFGFLKHLDIAIEPDGTFLAYKGINENYTDRHTGRIDNTPGQFHEMARNLVSDDPKTACHFGFHVGALSYAQDFGSVVVICRVDPEHVVCVPDDCDQKKMRVCKYEVIGEWNGEKMSTVDTTNVDKEEYEEPYYGLSDEWDDDGEGEDESDHELRGYESATGHGDEDDDAWPPLQPAVPASDEEVKPVILIKRDRTPSFDKLNTKELMQKSIEELRRYAGARLKIVGASKIPGGKAALVSKIMTVRRRRSK